MKKGLLIILALTTTLLAQAQVSDLVSMLSKEMNITTEQAEGGAGSIFNLAQENMSGTDFSTLSDAVPDMSGLLGAVPSLTGKKSGILGSAVKSVTGMPAVVGAFEKLGLKESQVAIMTPLLADYVDKKGGPAIANLFSKAVGM